MAKWVAQVWKEVSIQTIVSGFTHAEIISSNTEISYDEEENEDILTDDSLLKLFKSDSEESSFDGFEWLSPQHIPRQNTSGFLIING